MPEGRTLRRRLAAPLAGVSRRRARVTALRSRAGGAGSRAAGAGARAAGRGARAAGRGARWGIQRLVDEVLIRAPRLPAVGTWSVVPFLPGIPAEVATETITVIGIEIKLIAELHEVYGLRASGTVVDRMTAYTAAWANRRGVGLAPAGLVFAVGSPLRRRLQRRLAARAGQSVASLGPLLTGAAAGALINRHETRRLGGEIRDDLRQRSAISSHWPD